MALHERDPSEREINQAAEIMAMRTDRTSLVNMSSDITLEYNELVGITSDRVGEL